MIPTVLAWLVILIALPANWYVTVRLWRLSRSAPTLRVLRERAVVALFLAILVTIFAAVFLNNEMEVPPLDQFATRLITRGAVLALSIPALYWLFLYRRD